MELKNSPIVLIIDDEPSLVRALSRVLERGKIRSIAAASVEEAWAILRAKDIALCIVDLALPGSNGIEFLRQLRAEAKFKDLPVIIYSGFLDHAVKESMTFRPFRLLKKPAEAEEILWTVQEGLRSVNKKTDA